MVLIAGFLPVFLRRPPGGWLRLHMEFMVWSYIGLLAAAVSEAAVRIPQTPFWWSVAGGTAVVIVTGALIWAHNRPRLLAQFMRRPG
jgi:hypothetical protein